MRPSLLMNNMNITWITVEEVWKIFSLPFFYHLHPYRSFHRVLSSLSLIVSVHLYENKSLFVSYRWHPFQLFDITLHSRFCTRCFLWQNEKPTLFVWFLLFDSGLCVHPLLPTHNKQVSDYHHPFPHWVRVTGCQLYTPLYTCAQYNTSML